MDPLKRDELKLVIESQHGGTATFSQAVRVLQAHNHPEKWDGVVSIFDVKGNAAATRAYAWAVPIGGAAQLRYYAVLHSGAITNPVAAVKAAATAVQKAAAH
jgi:hypothetical protein